MFLIDIDILVKQLIPPHWRVKEKLNIFMTLTEPLKSIYKSIQQLSKESKSVININSQVIVLEKYIDTFLDYGRTSIVDDSSRGFILRVSDKYKEREKGIKQMVDKLKLSGISYRIQFIKE
jgi:hypothetical protein